MADRYCLFERQGHHLQSNGTIDLEADGGTTGLGIAKANSRAKWSHQMKLYLIRLLKDHDVRAFRTHNAWSKEAWNNILHQLNQKFDQSFTLNQVKQKEQDLKKDYRTVKELLDESGFGWDKDRKMVDAPDSVWASCYAEGRTRQGMDHYTSMRKHAPVPSSQKHAPVPLSQSTQMADLDQSPSRTLQLLGPKNIETCYSAETSLPSTRRSFSRNLCIKA
ncbi:hypothetical protein ZWY2020_004173 [Hordeum vulgare]|nr:hypothetical protein ZWY2020_004173 [Hordeum vulgare]